MNAEEMNALLRSMEETEKYWFVVAYGPGIYATLLAEEIDPEEGQRFYEGFYTFEPNAAFQIISLLHHMFPTQVSPPIAPQDQEKE